MRCVDVPADGAIVTRIHSPKPAYAGCTTETAEMLGCDSRDRRNGRATGALWPAVMWLRSRRPPTEAGIPKGSRVGDVERASWPRDRSCPLLGESPVFGSRDGRSWTDGRPGSCLVDAADSRRPVPGSRRTGQACGHSPRRCRYRTSEQTARLPERTQAAAARGGVRIGPRHRASHSGNRCGTPVRPVCAGHGPAGGCRHDHRRDRHARRVLSSGRYPDGFAIVLTAAQDDADWGRRELSRVALVEAESEWVRRIRELVQFIDRMNGQSRGHSRWPRQIA